MLLMGSESLVSLFMHERAVTKVCQLSTDECISVLFSFVLTFISPNSTTIHSSRTLDHCAFIHYFSPSPAPNRNELAAVYLDPSKDTKCHTPKTTSTPSTAHPPPRPQPHSPTPPLAMGLVQEGRPVMADVRRKFVFWLLFLFTCRSAVSTLYSLRLFFSFFSAVYNS